MKYLAFLGLAFVPAASIAVSYPGTEGCCGYQYMYKLAAIDARLPFRLSSPSRPTFRLDSGSLLLRLQLSFSWFAFLCWDGSGERGEPPPQSISCNLVPVVFGL